MKKIIPRRLELEFQISNFLERNPDCDLHDFYESSDIQDYYASYYGKRKCKIVKKEIKIDGEVFDIVFEKKWT